MHSWFIPLIGISLAARVFCREGLNASENQGDTDRSEAGKNGGICNTTACHQVANVFISAMNESIHPCDDFYRFSCGGLGPENLPKVFYHSFPQTRFDSLSYQRLKEILESNSSEDIQPIQMMKEIYKSCNDARDRGLEDPEIIDSMLRIMKGWPMITSNDTWNIDAVTWQEVDRHYEELAGINAFFDVTTASDPKDYAALKLTNNDYYVPLTKWGKILRPFINRSRANVSTERLRKEFWDVHHFKLRLYEGSNRNDEMSFPDVDSFIKWWNQNTTSSASGTQIDWLSTFQRISNVVNHPITNYTFIVQDPNYFRNLKELLQSTNERTIVNYVHSNFLKRITTYFNKDDEIDNSSLCVDGEDPAFAHLFIKKYVGNNMKIIADEMVTKMKKAFELQTRNSNWLSVESKDAIRQKLHRMEAFVGYPQWYNNETALNEYYKNLKIGGSYIDTLLSWLRVTWEGDIRRWRKPLEETVWFLDSTDLLSSNNGAYSPERNILMIPAGSFQFPISDGSLPDSVVYGFLGTLIGHELSHGFHAKEGFYSAYSNEPLYSDEMTKIYNERVRCLKKESNSTEKPSTEDEADWNGLQIAFHAYKELKSKKNPNGESKLPGFQNFTDEQMFFLSYAQRYCIKWMFTTNAGHSSQYQRVQENLYNNVAFAKAFNCRENSPMNPKNKCNLWMTPNITR